MKKKKVIMTFEAEFPLDIMVDKESLEKEFGGDIHRVAKYLYREEGEFWDKKMKLIKTKII